MTSKFAAALILGVAFGTPAFAQDVAPATFTTGHVVPALLGFFILRCHYAKDWVDDADVDAAPFR